MGSPYDPHEIIDKTAPLYLHDTRSVCNWLSFFSGWVRIFFSGSLCLVKPPRPNSVTGMGRSNAVRKPPPPPLPSHGVLCYRGRIKTCRVF